VEEIVLVMVQVVVVVNMDAGELWMAVLVYVTLVAINHPQLVDVV
jgi:hypothetical protein